MVHPDQDLKHEHVFLGEDHARNERKVWLVIALTTVTMLAEILAGSLFGSMALTADGWHMATHAGAMSISAFAYLYARRQARNPRYTFGTGKLGDLAGFASAIVLAMVALLIAWESLRRFADPVPIEFDQAILVAVLGLAVNLLSAWLLRDDRHQVSAIHHHDHGGHDHASGHVHARHAEDHNLRAAYLHVLADSLTSCLAIVALLLGRSYGWNWLDPVIGIVGGLIIARWSVGLIRATATVLLDARPDSERLAEEVRRHIEGEGDRICDLHVWQLGPGHHAAILSVLTANPRIPSFYKEKLRDINGLSHVTVEVTPLEAA